VKASSCAIEVATIAFAVVQMLRRVVAMAVPVPPDIRAVSYSQRQLEARLTPASRMTQTGLRAEPPRWACASKIIFTGGPLHPRQEET